MCLAYSDWSWLIKRASSPLRSSTVSDRFLLPPQLPIPDGVGASPDGVVPGLAKPSEGRTGRNYEDGPAQLESNRSRHDAGFGGYRQLPEKIKRITVAA